MPPTTRTKTSVGMETVGETVNRAKALVAPTNIPVAAVENTAPPALNIPEPTLPTVVNTEGVTAAADQTVQSIQEREAQRKEVEAKQAEAVVSENERAIREAAGILNTESAKRTELEEKAGIPKAQEDLRNLATGLSIATNNLREFDLNFVNSIEQMRVSGAKKDMTKRTFNAASAEANTQMAVQRAGMVSSIYAQQASIQILQDNVKGATEAIDKALKSFYDPIRQEMELEKMFYQRNSQLFDSAQNRAANARLAAIEQEQAVIDRAINLVDAAVTSGYASGNDIQVMTSLSGDPEAQAQYARGIVAKGAREAIALDRMAKNASIAASATSRRANLMQLAAAGDPAAIAELGFDPGAPIRAQEAAELDKTLSAQIDSQNDIIDKFTKVAGMTSAIKSSTGVMQNSFLSGILPQKAPDGGLRSGITGGLDAMADKEEFLNTMNYLLLGDGFKQFSRLKDEGVSLTPVSEIEFQAVMDSASVLNNMAEKKDGKIVGFGNVKPEVIEREVQSMIDSAAKVRDEKAAIRALGYDGYIQLQQLNQTQ